MNVSIQVNSSVPINLQVNRGGERGLTGQGFDAFDVADYGAVGDGTTDDSAAIQAAIDALETAQRGTLFFHPLTYKVDTGLVFNPSNLVAQSFVEMKGATIYAPNITGDVITVESNVTAVNDQDAEKSYKFKGLHVKGSSSADSGLRVKSCFGSYYDTVMEDFTSVTAGQAAIVLDALFLEWVEENHFVNLDIKNCGNGIAFISREDSGGTAASLMNNYFSNAHIWCKVANGKGVHGVGLGASTTANIGRCIFMGIVVHPFEANNITAFDFTNCYVESVILIAPSVDVYGSPSGIVAFDYNNSEQLVIISPSGHPISEVDTYFDGGGKYTIVGKGNMTVETYLDRYTDVLDEDNMASNSDTKVPTQQSVKAYADTKQTSDSDLTAIAGLSPSNDDILQRKAGAWTNRTMTQLIADLGALNTTFQPLDSDLTSWAAITRAAGFDTFAATPSGANLASLLTSALPASKGGTGLTALAANIVSILGAADYAAVRTLLGLVIGTNVQAYDADLATIAGLTATTDNFMQAKSSAWASRTPAQVKTDLKIDTKMIWVVPQSPAGAESFYGDHLVRSMGTTGEVGLEVAIPADFVSVSSAVIVGIPDASETIQYDIDVDIAAVGETHQTHTAQSLNATKAVTLNTLYAIDIASLLSSAAAGDYVGIRLGSDTDFMYILGLKLIYNT